MLIGLPADRAMAGAVIRVGIFMAKPNHIVAIAVQKSEFLFTFTLYSLASKKSKEMNSIFLITQRQTG